MIERFGTMELIRTNSRHRQIAGTAIILAFEPWTLANLARASSLVSVVSLVLGAGQRIALQHEVEFLILEQKGSPRLRPWIDD